MKVVRIPPLGKLVVEAGAQRFQSLDEVKDGALRQRLLAAIGELVVFAGGYDRLLAAGVAPPPELPTTTPQLGGRLTSEQEAFLSSLENELKATARRGPSALPTATSAAQFNAQLEALTTQRTADDVVANIDQILQRHLAQEPGLAGRTIRLEQLPDGALRIRADEKFYMHPREVEDETVRRVLRQALLEWEQR
jgi:hypothetical protein